MNTVWKNWSERRGQLSQQDVMSGMRDLSLAYRDIEDDVRIPLMTRIRPLPEIVRMMRTAEFSNDPEDAALLCLKLNTAPNDLRKAVMHLRSTLMADTMAPAIASWRNEQMEKIGDLDVPYPAMVRFVEAYSLAAGFEGAESRLHHWENTAIAAHDLLAARYEGWSERCDKWFEGCVAGVIQASFPEMRDAALTGSVTGYDRSDILASLNHLHAEFFTYEMTSTATRSDRQNDPDSAAAPHTGLLGYYINLDERGDFYADIRNEDEQTIFEIRNEDDEISLIVNGFMSHKEDLDGLQDYLKEIGLIDGSAELLSAKDFEHRLSAPSMEM